MLRQQRKKKKMGPHDSLCLVCVAQFDWEKSIIGRRAGRTKTSVSDGLGQSRTTAATHYWLPDDPEPGVRGEKDGDVGE